MYRIIYFAILLGLLILTKYFVPDRSGLQDEESVQPLIEALHSNPIRYSKHAECRMDCRTISAREVTALITEGRINPAKSDLKDKPCPTLAVEGRTDDGQEIRVIYAVCESQTTVVTAIDLQNEYSCTCK